MTNQDLNQEIELLRKQLETLKSEREAEKVAADLDADSSAGEDPEQQVAADETRGGKAGGGNLDLMAQFKELLESLDKDINDTKPTTLLIVFALGVLVGRI